MVFKLKEESWYVEGNLSRAVEPINTDLTNGKSGWSPEYQVADCFSFNVQEELKAIMSVVIDRCVALHSGTKQYLF